MLTSEINYFSFWFGCNIIQTEDDVPAMTSRHWQSCFSEAPRFSQPTSLFKWLREEQKAKDTDGGGGLALRRLSSEGSGAVVA